MNELVGILVFVVLFVLYAMLPPRRRGCGACDASGGERDRCRECVHGATGSEEEEKEESTAW